MKTIFLVWRNPATFSVTRDWLQMTGKEFASFAESGKAKGRYFIRLEDDNNESETIVIEATKEQYVDWRIKQHRKEYLGKWKAILEYEVVSYDALIGEDGAYGEELIQDDSVDVEREAFRNLSIEALRKGINGLPENEQFLIKTWLTLGLDTTIRELSIAICIPRNTISRRIISAKEHLKNFLE